VVGGGPLRAEALLEWARQIIDGVIGPPVNDPAETKESS
jgi:hypothetical protein